MNSQLKHLALAALTLAAVACGDPSDPASAQQDLAATGLQNITITKAPATTELEACVAFFDLDVATSRLTGMDCLDGESIPVRRELDPKHVAIAQAALAAVVEVPRPETCDPDLEEYALVVAADDAFVSWGNAAAVCDPTTKPADRDALQALFTTLQGFSRSAR